MSNPSPNESNHAEATDRAVAAGGDSVDSTIVTSDVTAESLLMHRTHRSQAKLKLQWRGALRDWRARYTSVELQHQALAWWGHDAPR
jgi:hypothetical protein